jgi:peptide/nickel transport system permease protein
MATVLPAIIGGSIVIETALSNTGHGLELWPFLPDTLLMAIFTFSALLTLCGILIADFLYTLVDPRIAYAKRAAA